MNLFQKSYKDILDFNRGFFHMQQPLFYMKQLVDKATPRKINANTDWYECPNCLSDLIPIKLDEKEKEYIDSIGYEIKQKHIKYCMHCGQALDWSETE